MDRCSRLTKNDLHPQPLFIVEAELDALLLWQKAGDLVDVAALATDKAGALNATRLAAL